MVKLELSDSNLMLLGGIGSLACGFHALAAPDNFQDLYFGPKETHPIRSHAAPELVCWNGHSLASVGALTLAVRDHLSQEGTRRWFQTSGVVYGTAAAMAATNAFRGRERKSVGYGSAAVMGALGALKLWRGFKKNNSSLTT